MHHVNIFFFPTKTIRLPQGQTFHIQQIPQYIQIILYTHFKTHFTIYSTYASPFQIPQKYFTIVPPVVEEVFRSFSYVK